MLRCMQLDILAGVKVSGRAQGHVLVNGMPRKQCGFAALASYVQQKDVLVPSATVRRVLGRKRYHRLRLGARV